MRLTLLLIILASFSTVAQEWVPVPAPEVEFPNQPIHQHAEIWTCGCGMETHYAGGRIALSRFVNEHIYLPTGIPWGNTTHVRAYVQFIVERDGSLSDIHIVKTNFPEIDEAILAVFQGMNNWVAGEWNCETVRTRVRVPISIEVR